MSWDINLVVNVDGEEVKLPYYDPRNGWDVYGSINYTHNTNPMIRIKFPGWSYEGLSGMSAKTLIEKLQPVVEDMNSRKKFYDDMNPDNGWGSRESLIQVLNELIAWCKRFPSAIVEASF